MPPGFVQAKEVFLQARKRVPAYSSFLQQTKKPKIKPTTWKQWLEVPLTTKENYIHTFSLDRRIPKGKFPPMLYGSSGTTGQPTYWFGNDLQEQLSKVSHEKLFRDMFGVTKNTATLMMISFAMDVWIAGHHTMQACRDMSRLGYNFSVVTPGYSEERTLQALQFIAPMYSIVIFAGHPAFVMDIVTQAKRKKLLSPKHEYKVLVTGHKISEKWRKDLAQLLNIQDPAVAVTSLYGSTDAGKMGHETPLSNFIRRECEHNAELCAEVFGTAGTIPGLYQYHPKHVFFEEVNKELILTSATAVPLIRYNIHDIGHVVSYPRVYDVLSNFGLLRKAKKYGLSKWKLPFLVVEGRSNVATTFYALHIYPEHIKAGVDNRANGKYLSGKFFAFTKTVNKSKREQFHIVLELARGIDNSDVSKSIENSIRKILVEELQKMNIEYRKLSEMIGTKALPHLHFKKYGTKQFYPKHTQGVLQSGLGKPKVILKD